MSGQVGQILLSEEGKSLFNGIELWGLCWGFKFIKLHVIFNCLLLSDIRAVCDPLTVACAGVFVRGY